MMPRLGTKLKNKNATLICLIVIIAIQCVISIFYGTYKNGFHEDEIATYQLANDANGYIGWDQDAMNTWLSGTYYKNMMSVSEDERFDFSIPYENQEKDVHPFLYYFVVHFVCSIFPETNWKWLGIAINLFFCLITSVLMFKLSKAVMHSDIMSLICVLAWGWSVGAVGTTLFLRMYAMLGMWCVLFALLLTELVQNITNGQTIKKHCWVALFLVTVAGVLTQYYFLVFCFFACLIALIYFLVKREWKKGIIFTITEVGGVIFSIICFPAMLDQIFNGYRGTEAFENFASSSNYFQNLIEIIITISNELFNGWIKEIIIISIVVLILYWIFCIFHPKFSIKDGALTFSADPDQLKPFSISIYMNRGGVIAFWGMVCIIYIALISRIAPYQSDRYYMCIYPILVMIAVFLLYSFGKYVIKKKEIACVFSLIIVLFVTGASYVKQTVPYLYTNYAERMEILTNYTEYPVIVVNLASHSSTVNPWVYEFAQFQNVYRCSFGSFEEVENAVNTKDLTGGFLVYAVGSKLTDEEFIENISNYIEITDWRVLTNINTKVYFCETGN